MNQCNVPIMLRYLKSTNEQIEDFLILEIWEFFRVEWLEVYPKWLIFCFLFVV